MRLGLCLIMMLVLARPDAQAAQDDLPTCMGQGAPQRCMCEIGQLRPTQVSLGFLHVQDILRDEPSKLQARAREKPTQVVIGPDRRLYVTDGHHHARAMLEQSRQGTGPATTICQVVEDDSAMAPSGREAFLVWLADHGHARLNGGDDMGGAIRPGLYPPETLDMMTNDTYRSLASFMEDGCRFKAQGDFGEFPLADLMRQVQVRAPSELAHKNDQGRRAAAELVAGLGTGPMRTAFQVLPYHDKIEGCSAVP